MTRSAWLPPSSHRQPGCVVLTMPRCPMPRAPGGGSRAKRTVVEGSGGRLIPFRPSRVLETDAQRCRHGPLLLRGSPFRGAPQVFLSPIKQSTPFRPFTSPPLPCLSPIPAHNSRQPPHVVLLSSVPFMSSSHILPLPQGSCGHRFLASGIMDGAHCPPSCPFLVPHAVLCLSNRSRASTMAVWVAPYIDRLAGNVTTHPHDCLYPHFDNS